MRDPDLSNQAPRKAENARDLQAQLYREIGISAVAAALRFTNQPEPVKRPDEAGQDRPQPDRPWLAA